MLDINIKAHQGILFVRLKGNLNQNSLGKLKTEVSRLVKEVGIKNIVFNLTELDLMDSAGAEELIRNYNYCNSNFGTALFVSEKSNSYIENCLQGSLIHDEKTAANLINT